MKHPCTLAGGNVLALKARLNERFRQSVPVISNSLLPLGPHDCNSSVVSIRKCSLSENIQHLLHKATILQAEHNLERKAQKHFQRRKFLNEKASKLDMPKLSPDASKENVDIRKSDEPDHSNHRLNRCDEGLKLAKRRVYQDKVKNLTLQLQIERIRFSKLEAEISRYENSISSLTNLNRDHKSVHSAVDSKDESLCVSPRTSICFEERIPPVSNVSSFIYLDDSPSGTSSNGSKNAYCDVPIKLNQRASYSRKSHIGYTYAKSTKLPL